MIGLLKFAVSRPVLVNLIMVAIALGGIFAVVVLPQEQVPNVSFPWAFVVVIDTGVSPEEIEKAITIPLEEELQDLDDLESMTSNSREGASFIWLKFSTMPEDKFARRLQDVRTEVQKVRLPDTAEDPDITQFKTQDFAPLVSVILRGRMSEHLQKRIAEDLREDILDIDNVSQVTIAGVREREVWVEVDPSRLERYGLTLDEVGESIRRKHVNLTGGDVATGRTDFRVRTTGEAARIAELEDVIVRAAPGGGHIRVSDVAVVSDTFEDEVSRARFNGEPAVTLTVAKKQEGNSIKIIEQVKVVAARYERDRLPAGCSIAYTNDSSVIISDILGTLKSNAWIGMLLVAVSLYLFLGWRQAMFAAIGIPIALAATFLFLYLTGNTINSSTLFALVLVLGMLVDDAVVVIENCYRYIQRGMEPRRAAIVGTREVLQPVFVSAGTTVAAFLPLMLLPGVIGDFMRIIPIVVSLALAASLFESFFILPSHVAEWSRKPREGAAPEKPVIGFRWVQKRYRRLLVKCIRRRAWVIAVTSVVILGSLPVAFALGVDMFADEEIPFFFVYVTLPEGTRLEATDRTIRRIEEIVSEALPETDLKNIDAVAGMQERESEWVVKPSVGRVLVELHENNVRRHDLATNMNLVRERAELVPGITSLELHRISSGPPTGAPVEAKVRGEHLGDLGLVAEEVKQVLAGIDGVKDIRDDFLAGIPELRVVVDEERAAMVGLSVADVARTVNTAFAGSVVTEFLDGDDDIDVLVRLREESRENAGDLENLLIPVPSGGRVLLKDVARIVETGGYSTIKRDDNQRAITITANVDDEIISGVEASRKLEEAWPAIAARHPGHNLKFGGEFEEFQEAFTNLGFLFLVGIAIMLTLMAGQFNSISQPLIIFLAVIFAFWGAVMGLFVIGSTFSINNLFGLVALAGVAVNNSIVLISFVNSLRERGYNRFRAVLMASQLRVRPVLLTSLTTVVGLVPMAVGLGGYSEVWGPLATVMVWGLAASSLLTLFLIPSIYIVQGDIKRLTFSRRLRDETASRSQWKERRRRRRDLEEIDQPA